MWNFLKQTQPVIIHSSFLDKVAKINNGFITWSDSMLIHKPSCEFCDFLILENMVFLAITILSDLVTLIQKENSILKGPKNPETTKGKKDIRTLKTVAQHRSP